MIDINLELTATFCNSWPTAKITADNQTIWQGTVEQVKHISFHIPKDSTTIVISGINKSSGENNSWDTVVDSQGRIIVDKTMTLSWIRINNIDMTQAWIDNLPNIRFGVWYDNYDTQFTVESPVLDWIIRTKFVDTNLGDSKKMIYNDYNKKWNYTTLQQKINTLRQRLNHA